jgi:hypothetical protein
MIGDLFVDEVYVYTPKGEVKMLPAGSTPIDFAYAVHTDVGHKTVGARVNGRIVPLHYTLQSGDFVEVLTTKSGRGPSRDWLNLAKSSRARNKIRQWFSRETREDTEQKGRESLEQALKQQKLPYRKIAGSAVLAQVIREAGCTAGAALTPSTPPSGPAGPYHCASASGSVQAAKTLRRGCFSTLTSTISRSSDQVSNSFSIVIPFRLVQIGFQSVEPLGPASALRFHPVCRLLEARPLKPAPAAAPALFAGDQSAILQHFEMLGEGGQRHVERLSQNTDRHLAFGKPRYHGAAGRIAESMKGKVEWGRMIRHAPR